MRLNKTRLREILEVSIDFFGFFQWLFFISRHEIKSSRGFYIPGRPFLTLPKCNVRLRDFCTNVAAKMERCLSKLSNVV